MIPLVLRLVDLLPMVYQPLDLSLMPSTIAFLSRGVYVSWRASVVVVVVQDDTVW